LSASCLTRVGSRGYGRKRERELSLDEKVQCSALQSRGRKKKTEQSVKMDKRTKPDVPGVERRLKKNGAIA